MSTEDNKALVRRWYEEAFNQKKTAALDEFLDPNFVDHSLPAGMPAGIEGQKHLIGMYLTAFPDSYVTVEAMIAVVHFSMNEHSAPLPSSLLPG
jgi:predicted ester cyclase